MLHLMDQALQRLYWACRNKEDLPESLVRSHKAQITTKDILEGLGLDSADLNDSETRKSSTDTTVSSAESQNSVQTLPNKAALGEEININPMPSPLPSPSPSVSAGFDFGFDPPSTIPSRTQSTDTDTDTTTFTLPGLSASASPFDATTVQRLSTFTLPPPRYPPIPHRDSCQLHLVCRRRQLERQNRSLSKTSGASFLQQKDVPLLGVGNGDKGTENLSRAASCHDFKQQVLGKTDMSSWAGSLMAHRASYDSFLPSMSRMIGLDSPMPYQSTSGA